MIYYGVLCFVLGAFTLLAIHAARVLLSLDRKVKVQTRSLEYTDRRADDAEEEAIKLAERVLKLEQRKED